MEQFAATQLETPVSPHRQRSEIMLSRSSIVFRQADPTTGKSSGFGRPGVGRRPARQGGPGL